MKKKTDKTFDGCAESICEAPYGKKLLERYENVLAGSADRIVKLHEERKAAADNLKRQRLEHARQIQLYFEDGLQKNELFGELLFVVFALAFALIGTRVIELGHSAEGFAMIVGAGCGALVAFVRSVSRRRQLVDATESA